LQLFSQPPESRRSGGRYRCRPLIRWPVQPSNGMRHPILRGHQKIPRGRNDYQYDRRALVRRWGVQACRRQSRTQRLRTRAGEWATGATARGGT